MNVVLLAFVIQIFALYVMMLLSDYVVGMMSLFREKRRLKRSPARLRP